MIDITKNYQDVKIYDLAIANFNHTKNFHFLYIVSGAHHQHTYLIFKKKYINLLLLSFYKGSSRIHGLLPLVRIQRNGNYIILA